MSSGVNLAYLLKKIVLLDCMYVYGLYILNMLVVEFLLFEWIRMSLILIFFLKILIFFSVTFLCALSVPLI